MPIDLQLCEKVRQTLADARLSQPLTPTVTKTPKANLEELATLLVLIVPVGKSSAFSTRGDDVEETYAINVGVQKQAPTDDDFDDLSMLRDEIFEYISRKHRRSFDLGEYVMARLTSTTNEPPYEVEHLKRDRVFTSVIELTYTVHRELGD